MHKKGQHNLLTDFEIGCGDRIRTYDLRVMSPTSYQTAPPRGETKIMTLFIFESQGNYWWDP